MKCETLEQTQAIYSGKIANPNFDIWEMLKSWPEDKCLGGLRAWAISEGRKAKDFDAAAHRWKVTLELGDVPTNVQEFVRLYAERHGWVDAFDGTMVMSKGNSDFAEALRLLELENERLRLRFTERNIKTALVQARKVSRDEIIAAACAKIAFREGIAPDWDTLAAAITDQTVTPLPLTVAALKAVIWQVKRKLTGLPVTDHAMVVFQGPQWAGKSTFAVKLAAPLGEMMAKADFAQITDKSYHELWESPLIFLDEMNYANRRDVGAIKEAVTKSTHTARVFHTHSATTIRCRHVMIGAMNGQLSDLIKDPTGMRRFVPIQYLPAPHTVNEGQPCVDYAVIDAVDWLALWQSVDPAAQHPLLPVRDLWMAASESEREMTCVEAWLRDVSGQYSLRDRELDPAMLRSEYADWCERNGYPNPLTTIALGRKISGFENEAWFPLTAQERTGVKRFRKWKPDILAKTVRGKLATHMSLVRDDVEVA